MELEPLFFFKYFISSVSVIIINLCVWEFVHVSAVLTEDKRGSQIPWS